MAPASEETIATNFLLLSSSLTTIVSLNEFKSYFPKRLRNHPQVITLYRELQHVRSQDVDMVKENIQHELQKGGRRREELRRAYNATSLANIGTEEQLEMEMDYQLFGNHSNEFARENMHNVNSLLSDMESACSALENEVELKRQETAGVLDEVSQIVGDLSDLKYGKFNSSAGTADMVVGDTIDGLKQLEKVCDAADKH